MTKSPQIAIKYALDRVMGSMLLILILPFLAIIALAIWLEDHGPALFRQERVGLHGRTFRIFKFRTMIVNADRYLDLQGMPTRPRITRVGRFLRRTSLDEIPQLFNIVRGEMSFIGPRPVLLAHEKAYTGANADRLKMRPGVSGMAQVSGRNTLPWSKRLNYDLEYVRNYTLGLDLKILVKTVVVAITMQGISEDRNKSVMDDL